jgi:uncharacterized protein YaiI (UPF0178 family)
MLTIWIDNDACQKTIREMIFKTALKRGVEVKVVANSYMFVPINPLIQMIKVDSGPDIADDYIAEQVKAGDLVITADIPLAGRIVAKGALGLSPRGEVFNAENVSERLATRNLLQDLRSGGEITGGPPGFSEGDKKRFADAFDRMLTRLMKG